MLYACNHPERIDGIFFQSPACATDDTRPGYIYDPYTQRVADNEDVYPSHDKVDQMIENYANDVHIQDQLHGMPYWMVKMGCNKEMKKMIPVRDFGEQFIESAAKYYALMVQRWGQQDLTTYTT